MVKLEITEKAANELANILTIVEEDMRSRKNPPKGLTTAEAWDRLEAIRELNAALDVCGSVEIGERRPAD